MIIYEISRKRYAAIKKEWDAAIDANDSEALERLEDDLMDAEDEMRFAFLKGIQMDVTALQLNMILSIAHSEEFIERIAKEGALASLKGGVQQCGK